jgi:hypothetical protein
MMCSPELRGFPGKPKKTRFEVSEAKGTNRRHMRRQLKMRIILIFNLILIFKSFKFTPGKIYIKIEYDKIKNLNKVTHYELHILRHLIIFENFFSISR